VDRHGREGLAGLRVLCISRCHAGHPPRCCRDEKAADGTKRGPARFRKYSKSRAKSPRSLKLIGRVSDGHRIPATWNEHCASFVLPVPQREPTLKAEGEARAWPALRADQLPGGREFGRPLFAFGIRIDGGAPAGPAGPRGLGTVRASSAWPAESVPPAWSTRQRKLLAVAGYAERMRPIYRPPGRPCRVTGRNGMLAP
jgi:hypothetical protein